MKPKNTLDFTPAIDPVPLTWDELANEYDRITGGRARTRPMDAIVEWAKKHPSFHITAEGSIHKIRTINKEHSWLLTKIPT